MNRAVVHVCQARTCRARGSDATLIEIEELASQLTKLEAEDANDQTQRPSYRSVQFALNESCFLTCWVLLASCLLLACLLGACGAARAMLADADFMIAVHGWAGRRATATSCSPHQSFFVTCFVSSAHIMCFIFSSTSCCCPWP